jgi:excisionase family DNA binding protein
LLIAGVQSSQPSLNRASATSSLKSVSGRKDYREIELHGLSSSLFVLALVMVFPPTPKLGLSRVFASLPTPQDSYSPWFGHVGTRKAKELAWKFSGRGDKIMHSIQNEPERRPTMAQGTIEFSQPVGAIAVPEVLTLPEAAVYLRVPEADVLNLVHGHGLPGRQIGGEWRFLKAGLQDWLRTPETQDFWSTHFGALRGDPYLDAILERVERERQQAEGAEE